MGQVIEEETYRLKRLLTEERFKIPDQGGTTPLLAMAHSNSLLSKRNPDKQFQEDVVCNLVKSFGELNQINFSELETYISVSEFSGKAIIAAFKNYVVRKDGNEDIVFKACIARCVQNLEGKAFSLDYVLERFRRLKKLDPWLLAELVIVCNWQEGVEQIRVLLSNRETYNASYLFSLLPTWIKESSDERDLRFAMTIWREQLDENDKLILNYYAKNFMAII